MSKSIYSISLDLHKTQSQASLDVKQGDTDRQIHITLHEDGKPYKIESGALAVFSAITPCGHTLEDRCSIINDTIIYDFHEAVTSVSGVMNIEIRLYDCNSGLISTPSFTLIIAPRAAVGDAVVGSNSFTALDEMYKQTNVLKKEIETKLEKGAFNGVGVASVEQVEKSDEDKGTNRLKIKLTNGDVSYFEVKNGSEGSQGIQGPQGTKGPQGDKGDRGDTGEAAGFGEITASANTIDIDSLPTVEVNMSGENTAKNLHFNFGIPSPKHSFAPVIHNIASGNTIKLTDVSPFKHELEIKCAGYKIGDMSRMQSDIPEEEINTDVSEVFTIHDKILFGSWLESFVGGFGDKTFNVSLSRSAYANENYIVVFVGGVRWDSDEASNYYLKTNCGFTFDYLYLDDSISLSISKLPLDTVTKTLIDMDRYVYDEGGYEYTTESAYGELYTADYLTVEDLEKFVKTVKEKNEWEDGQAKEFKIEWDSDDSNSLYVKTNGNWQYLDWKMCNDWMETGEPTMSGEYGLYFSGGQNRLDYCIFRVTPNVTLDVRLLVNDKEYPINADGTVSGVKSESPNMTIKVNHAEEATVSVVYNADTKKYIDNQIAGLAAMILNS